MFKRLFNALKFGRRFFIEVARRGFGFSGGVFVDENSSLQVSAFYRGIIYISSQIAKLPWEVKDRDNNVLSEDPIYYLLNVAPNNEMTSFSFKMTQVQNAILHGNAYAEIERNRLGNPIGLWPLDSRFVEPYRVPETLELVYRVLGGSAIRPGTDAYLSPKDILHFKNFHSKDGINGQGVVAYGKEVLGISLGADRMAGNLFANGGIPSGVLQVDGSLSPEAHERIKTGWKDTHGNGKSGGIAILEEGMKYQQVNMSPDILQFLESRQFNVLEIARFLGVPPTKLFDTSAAKFNNMENANLEVANDTFGPWAANLEAEVDIKLLNGRRGGKRTEMDLYQMSKGDMQTRGMYWKDMMQVGSITPNQIRKKEGMAPYSGGDRYYIATNNYTPADRVDEVVDAQIAKGNNSGSNNNNSNSNQDPQLTKAVVTYLTGKK